MGKTGIKPRSDSVPFLINRLMFGRSDLNWYPNRNPSEEIRRMTGRLSFERDLMVESSEEDGDEDEVEEKKRKAKRIAAVRETTVEMRSRTMVGRGFAEEEEEDKRAAEDEFGSSSSSFNEIGIGLDSELELMRFKDLKIGCENLDSAGQRRILDWVCRNLEK